MFGQHLVQISSNSEMVELEPFVELTRNDPIPYFLEYNCALNTDRVSNISRGSRFTYWLSLTGLHCLRVISVLDEAMRIFASLFQIADLNL